MISEFRRYLPVWGAFWRGSASAATPAGGKASPQGLHRAPGQAEAFSVAVPVVRALVVRLAGLVRVPVLLLLPRRVLVLVDVAMGVRVAVNRPVGMGVLVGVKVLVLVCVHAFPSRLA